MKYLNSKFYLQYIVLSFVSLVFVSMSAASEYTDLTDLINAETELYFFKDLPEPQLQQSLPLFLLNLDNNSNWFVSHQFNALPNSNVPATVSIENNVLRIQYHSEVGIYTNDWFSIYDEFTRESWGEAFFNEFSRFVELGYFKATLRLPMFKYVDSVDVEAIGFENDSVTVKLTTHYVERVHLGGVLGQNQIDEWSDDVSLERHFTESASSVVLRYGLTESMDFPDFTNSKLALPLLGELTDFEAYREDHEKLFRIIHDLFEVDTFSQELVSRITQIPYTLEQTETELTLKSNGAQFTIRPVFQIEPNRWAAKVDAIYNGENYTFMRDVASLEQSGSLFRQRLVTQFPFIYNLERYPSENGLIGENAELPCEYVYGYVFNADNTAWRSIECYGGEIRYQGSNSLLMDWQFETDEIVTRKEVAAYQRHRHWLPLSINDKGDINILEYSKFQYLYDDYLEGFFVTPRTNVLKLRDLSQYAVEYAAGGYGGDNDSDGLDDGSDNDDDNDGISDEFENRYGLNHLDASDALTDSDSDGLTSLQEFEIGTDPLTSDTDNDGVNDGQDGAPLNPDSSLPIAVKGDVNGDGRVDLLWRSYSKGWNFLWTMNGTQTDSTAPINVVPDPTWDIVGQGDYNADGKSDLFWRNSSTGQNFIYLMDGSSIKTRYTLNYVGADDWIVAGSGDFNGDGTGDVLWRNINRGDTWFYQMQDGQIAISKPSLWVTDLNFKIVATADLDGDGDDDVLWRNISTGLNYVWLMENGEISSRYSLNSINTDWIIAGAGDLNGDGTDDIVLRNNVDGRNWAYLMERGQIKSSLLINTVSDINWQISHIGDYDGDDKADLLWRNKSNARNLVHLMDGVTVKAKGVLRPTDSTWKVAQ